MSEAKHESIAVITDWRIGARGPRAAIGGAASFTIVELDVSEVLKVAEAAVQRALKEENIQGEIGALELRIEFERRERSDHTTITGHATLPIVTQEPKP